MEQVIQEHISLLKKLLPKGIAFQLTETMLNKSTIDANKPIREFLNDNNIFDFDQLPKGEKEYIECQLFSAGSLFVRQVSLVRPSAKPDKPGDPRIWVYNLNKNAKTGDWIYFAYKDDIFYVIPLKTSLEFKKQINDTFGELNYIVSSGLKNLIGKQLITDEFVAIFELVKNSFDAYANKVDIIFQDLNTPNAKIIIQDDGKGMSFEELKNKWLFVGYSAKKDGSEDKDYRHNLGVKKVYAGAKGVGRFSCDRLGTKLKLSTRKDEAKSVTEVLYTDWKKFEENPQARFDEIGIKHEIIPSDISFRHGTRLEISDLQDKWERQQLIDLRWSLEKLILPTTLDEEGGLNDSRRKNFIIEVFAENEIAKDNEEKEKHGDGLKGYHKMVNGPIKNLIFETLKLRTTSIEVKISETGEEIETELIDRGTKIYKITEKNTYNLKNIKFKLFHLNQSAKTAFTQNMGFPIIYYGHVFIYKNGFRIYPFGDVEEDNFGVDIRKSHKEFSRIGTRSLSGKIEINGDYENIEFIESTSRDAGFIQNESYKALRNCYFDILTRFEKYVVDVVRWGKNIDAEDITDERKNEKMLELVSDITGSDSLIKVWYNENLLNILESKQENSAKTLLQNLQKTAEKLGDDSFSREISQAQQRISELELVTRQAEEIASNAQVTVAEAKKALEFEQQKNKYLLATDKNLTDDMRSLLHNVKLVTEKIYLNIDILSDKVKNGELTNSELLERLGTIKFNADKAFRMSKLITKADFRAKQDKSTIEIRDYIEEYINDYNTLFDNRKLKFEFHRIGGKVFRKVSLLDLSIVIDNLISNAEKKKADKIRIDFKTLEENKLEVLFSDNGIGLSVEFIKNPEIIFDLGITDTDGSGIGLHTSRNVLKNNEASIYFDGNGRILKGASFKILFN